MKKSIVALLVAGVYVGSASAQPPELAKWLGPQHWDRDMAGPIISLGKAGDFDDMHIFAATVALEHGKYSLWYCGSRGNPNQRVFRLGLATSADGKHFEKYDHNPVLQFQDGAHSILTPALLRDGSGAVLREDGKLRMWFSSAMLGKSGLHTLHEATSADGIHWSDPSPALLRNAYGPTVLKTEKGYELWYSDVSKRPWVFRHGISTDGRTWKVSERPVVNLSQEWEAEVLVYPTVLRIDGVYLMWYGSYDRAVRRETTAVGFAASLDGETWYKHPQNPIFRPDPKRPWESNYVGNGCVMRLPDGSFRYWYASRKEPPFRNLYFAINTAHWAGPAARAFAAGAAPEPVAAYFKRCEETKAAAIKAKEAEIAALRSTADSQKKLHAAEAQLKQLREHAAAFAPLPLPPKKGDAGVFATTGPRRNSPVDVIEIIDGDNAIVRAWYAPAADGKALEDVTFTDLWLHGIDTSDMDAGKPAKLSQVFHVTGNKTINTTCGQRSLPLLEVLEVEKYRKGTNSGGGK